MRKIEYVVSDERLITPSGLSLVGQILGKSNLIKKANRMRTEKRSQPQIKNGDILLTMIGLLSLGKSDFENVNEFHKDVEFYKTALGIAYGIPSESSLRNRLDGIGTSMAMRRSLPTSEQKVIYVIQSYVKASSIARAERRNFLLKSSQRKSR